MKPKPVKIPREEVGEWTEYRVSTWSRKETAVEEGNPIIIENEIQIIQNGSIIAKREVGVVPTEPWGEPSKQGLFWPEHRPWLWHLGYENKVACVMLLIRASLKEIDSKSPLTYSHYDSCEQKLETWHELRAEVSSFDPDTLLVWGNAGDDLYYLMVLQATPSGIVEPVGTSLYQAISNILDEYLSAATFVSSDHLLVIDDIGQLTLFDWKNVRQIASFSISDGLLNEETGLTRLWPEDNETDEYLIASGKTALIQNTLLVDIGESYPLNTKALVAFEPSSLTPLGMIRPPVTDEYLRYFGEKTFGFVRDGELHTWKLHLK